MDDGMQWLAGTILSAVISSVITVGFLSALCDTAADPDRPPE